MDKSSGGAWSLFGGSMKSNEFPEKAVVRELKEEMDFPTGHFVYFREYFTKKMHKSMFFHAI